MVHQQAPAIQAATVGRIRLPESWVPRLHDAAGQCLGRLKGEGNIAAGSVAVYPDGRTLVTGDPYGSIGCWDFPGHNPLGGWMVILLLLALSIQAGTGLFANDDIFIEGPLYPWVSKADSDFLTLIHKFNFDILLILIGLHVLAALFYLFGKHENLILPMLTGHKSMDPAFHNPHSHFASLWLAAALLGLSAGGVYLLVR